MKQTHTPGMSATWDDRGHATLFLNGESVGLLSAQTSDDDNTVRRIVSSYNACAGLNPEAVPEVIRATKRLLSAAQQVRDPYETNDLEWGDILSQAESALSATEEK